MKKFFATELWSWIRTLLELALIGAVLFLAWYVADLFINHDCMLWLG